jgi:hypothetical protein
MNTINIPCRFSGTVLFSHTQENNTIKVTLEKAVQEGAYLQYANLKGANLKGANLKGANLQYANLKDANLKGANLQYANLQYANLKGANLKGAKHDLVIPKIENLHQRVAEVVTKYNLNMSKWHCGTTHCHAGHIVNIAGQPGYDLEELLGTSTAALLIAKESSLVKLESSMFYVNDDKGLANIKRLAREEKELK